MYKNLESMNLVGCSSNEMLDHICACHEELRKLKKRKKLESTLKSSLSTETRILERIDSIPEWCPLEDEEN